MSFVVNWLLSPSNAQFDLEETIRSTALAKAIPITDRIDTQESRTQRTYDALLPQLYLNKQLNGCSSLWQKFKQLVLKFYVQYFTDLNYLRAARLPKLLQDRKAVIELFRHNQHPVEVVAKTLRDKSKNNRLFSLIELRYLVNQDKELAPQKDSLKTPLLECIEYGASGLEKLEKEAKQAEVERLQNIQKNQSLEIDLLGLYQDSKLNEITPEQHHQFIKILKSENPDFSQLTRHEKELLQATQNIFIDLAKNPRDIDKLVNIGENKLLDYLDAWFVFHTNGVLSKLEGELLCEDLKYNSVGKSLPQDFRRVISNNDNDILPAFSFSFVDLHGNETRLVTIEELEEQLKQLRNLPFMQKMTEAEQDNYLQNLQGYLDPRFSPLITDMPSVLADVVDGFIHIPQEGQPSQSIVVELSNDGILVTTDQQNKKISLNTRLQSIHLPEVRAGKTFSCFVKPLASVQAPFNIEE